MDYNQLLNESTKGGRSSTLAEGCMRHCASSLLFGITARSTAPF